MLKVGLTGGLGSGKSTVASMLAAHGAAVLSADEIARAMMQPGEPVYAAIVGQFGPDVVREDGTLDRPRLARMAFAEGRVEELNAIIHPATIAEQERLANEIGERDPQAVVVVESALIFETRFGADWRQRFDRMVLVTAPEALKVARFIERAGGGDRAALEAEARRRLAQMIADEVKAPQCDFVIRNGGTLEQLRAQVDALWSALQQAPQPDLHPGRML